MKQRHAWARQSAAACAALLSLTLSAPAGARAQAAGPQPHHPPPPAQPDLAPRAPSVRERQRVMDDMEREMSKGRPPRKSEELRLSEIAEDYRDMQQVNNKMMAAAVRAAEPDYKAVAASLGDILRRAERLRENLALPAPAPPPEGREEPGPKSAEDAAALKSALLALDKSIMSFVRSPVFRNTGVLDAETAAKAARDLDDVIERSRLASKDAERLAKKGKD